MLDVEANFLGVHNFVARLAEAKRNLFRVSVHRLRENPTRPSILIQPSVLTVVDNARGDGGREEDSGDFVFSDFFEVRDRLPELSVSFAKLRKGGTSKKDRQ